MKIREEAVEVRFPLGALAPTAPLARSKGAQRVAGDAGSMCARLRSQRMAVCDETGLLAVANGRVIDLYRADAVQLGAAATAVDSIEAHPNHPRDAHLPFAGQIVLGDHLEGSMDDQQPDTVVHATCVAFVAPGFLLVAATAVGSSSSPSVWLCGFRMYARSVTVTQRYAPSSLLVHCSFVDLVPGAHGIATLEIVPSDSFSSREAGAAMLLFDGASPSFGVFQWAERFSDRVLSIAISPSSTLTTLTISRDALWAALADESGTVHVLDFTRFTWELGKDSDPGSHGTASSGKRLALGPAFRMGRVSLRDHPLAAVRLVCQARTGADGSFGTALRWWRPEIAGAAKRYLLMGQSDGALAIMMLKRETINHGDHSVALKTVEIYPAIRALKNDPVVVISEPNFRESTNSFGFSTVSRTSWRQWSVAVHVETEKPRLQWPTLRDSLGLRTQQFDGQDSIDSILLSASTSLAVNLVQAISPEHQSASAWLLVLKRDEIRATAYLNQSVVRNEGIQTEVSTSKAPTDSVVSENQEETSSTKPPSRADNLLVGGEQDAPKETSAANNDNSEGQHSALTTLQDRYKLLPMRDPRCSQVAVASSGIVSASAATTSTQRLTKEQYNSRLAAMAQRVDRLNTNLHSLRTSFQLFTNDVQRHMTFISNHLEQLQDESASAIRNTKLWATVSRRDPEQQLQRSSMKSILQAQGDPARFDDSAPRGRRHWAPQADNNASEAAPAVVPHMKEKYDPDHPDADWGGFVHRTYKKKAQYSDHTATRQNLVVDAKGGIMPDNDAAIASSSFSGKKIFNPSQIPAGDAPVPGIKFQSAVYQVGPGADISCSNWKTSYEAQTSLEATPKDVYALGTRQNSQHKRHVTPMYEKTANVTYRAGSRTTSPSLDNNMSSGSSRGSSPSGLNGSDSSGSLSGRRVEPRRSLLAGIGKLVAAEDFGDKLARPEHHLSQAFADPTKKTLIAENHHNITLGYTGRKSSFR